MFGIRLVFFAAFRCGQKIVDDIKRIWYSKFDKKILRGICDV